MNRLAAVKADGVTNEEQMNSPKDHCRNRKRAEYLSGGCTEAAALTLRQLFTVFESFYELSPPQPAYKMI